MTNRAKDSKDLLRTPAGGGLAASPPPEQWDHWEEADPREAPGSQKRSYTIVPTVCFNCESACGLLAYVDKSNREIRKLEGHPLHPGSRGRNCPKGPATLNQINNPDRILKPLRRVGPRGKGRWEEVDWDEALHDIAGRVREAIQADRRDSVVYHVGRPGEDLFTERVLTAWGVDGHNSHTNVCSAAARTGYAFWMGMDRPNPDHENARFMLLMSSHLESGHYFTPHAQRIIESKLKGGKVCVLDTRLSNTASQADRWLSPWPGTEPGLLLAIANYLIQRDLIDREFVRRWTNWRELLDDGPYLAELRASGHIQDVPQGREFKDFLTLLKQLYAPYTLEWAEAETEVPATELASVAEEIAAAGTAFAAHVWRNAAAGHLGGWMSARCLFFLSVLTGSVGTRGGVIPNSWTKFVPSPHSHPDHIKTWNSVHWPDEYPLAHFEMGYLLPHLMKEQSHTLDVYFTRAHNPVWTNPDGTSWIDMLEGDSVGLHVALSPVWCETAQWADYVLPTGLGAERHDLHSYETHASQWIGFRQPVVREAMARDGEHIGDTRQANPGEVWEENEFWFELSWRIDPDGSLGIRQHFESPQLPGEKITVDEYYDWIFENSVPGLVEKATEEELTPGQYMRRYGAFELTNDVYGRHEQRLPDSVLDGAAVDENTGFVWSARQPRAVNWRPFPGPFKDERGRFRLGVQLDGVPVEGFPTPSGKLEFFSTTLKDWGWPEYALPYYPLDAKDRERAPELVSQVHRSRIDHAKSEYCLLPTFRLPNLIHTRTNGAKWLHEIAHTNPVWINPVDALRIGVSAGDLARVETELGHFVDRVWVTESVRPGVIACSHHLGRWRRYEDHGSDRWNSALVDLADSEGVWTMRQKQGVTAWKSSDPDSERLWWTDGGVHQNLAMPVQPDPISGQHCWHQKVRVIAAGPDDQYGDITADSTKSYDAYQRWKELCRPGPGPGGLRRPYWLQRPLKPDFSAYFK